MGARGRKVTPFGVGPDGEPTKVCYKCSTSKSLSEFHKDKSRADGYNSSCIPCARKKMAVYNKLPEVLASKNESQKRYAARNTAQIAAYKKQYAEENKEEINARAAEYREANRDEINAKQRVLNATPEAQEYRKQYHEDNKEVRNAQSAQYHQEHKEEINARHRAAQRAHPERTRYYANAKYAKLKLTRMSGKKNIRRREQISGDPCFYCGERKEEMHDDHFYPLARGGSNHWWNLVRACADCNHSKHSKLVSEWVQ